MVFCVSAGPVATHGFGAVFPPSFLVFYFKYILLLLVLLHFHRAYTPTHLAQNYHISINRQPHPNSTPMVIHVGQ